jgi:hypothetical protein
MTLLYIYVCISIREELLPKTTLSMPGAYWGDAFGLGFEYRAMGCGVEIVRKKKT